MNKEELKKAINAELKRHNEAMKDLNSKLRVIVLDEESKRRKSYADRKKTLDTTGDWLNKSSFLKVGDLVQVTGSRAGKYRVVAGFTSYGIIGKVAFQKREKQMDGTIKNVWSTSELKVTDQMFNKITHIYRKGEFVPVQKLMEESNEMV